MSADDIERGTRRNAEAGIVLFRDGVESYQFPKQAVEWDFVLSCAEPLKSVTGGIGTYSRMLAQYLSPIHKRVLLITAGEFSTQHIPENVSIIAIKNIPNLPDGTELQNLNDHLRLYSFHLARLLTALFEVGHRFREAEFPDYGNDGYFTTVMRQAGALDIGKVYIRLHSPHLMLRDDNLWPVHLTPTNIVEHSDAERFTFMQADHLLYGGTAMLERVLSYFNEEERQSLRSRSVQIPHPWPLARVPTMAAAGHAAALVLNAEPAACKVEPLAPPPGTEPPSCRVTRA